MRPVSLGSLPPLEAEKDICVGLFYPTDIKVGSNWVLTQAYPDHPWNKTVDTLGDNIVLLLIYNYTVVMRYYFTGSAAIRCEYLTLIWCNSIAMIQLNNSPLKLTKEINSYCWDLCFVYIQSTFWQHTSNKNEIEYVFFILLCFLM